MCACGRCSKICTKKDQRGREHKYIHGHSLKDSWVKPSHPFGRGSKNIQWKGGKSYIHGYVLLTRPNHPHGHHGYVREHRLIMEEHLGRLLYPWEVVHHINGIKDDNRLENLVLMDKSLHIGMHSSERVVRAIRNHGHIIGYNKSDRNQ